MMNVKISDRLANAILTWARDEICWWPDDTAYQRDLRGLVDQMEAAAAPVTRSVPGVISVSVGQGSPRNSNTVTLLIETTNGTVKHHLHFVNSEIAASNAVRLFLALGGQQEAPTNPMAVKAAQIAAIKRGKVTQ